MKFHEFAQLLHPIIGGASSTHAFVRTLFDAIIIDEGRDVLEEVSEDTYKAYYNGNTGISRIAKKLNPYLEAEEFITFLDEFQDSTRDTLCDKFHDYLQEANSYNIAELLADLFKDIITEAASTKRKCTTKSAKKRAAERRQKIADATGAVVVEDFVSLLEGLVNENASFDEEHIDKEKVDDETSATPDKDGESSTVIQHQTNVIQNGENNSNLTNNGTLNFNF